MSNIKIILWCAATLPLHAEITNPKLMVVNVAVANLRYQPQAHDPAVKLPTSDLTHPLQITQLLLGEHVIALEEYFDDQHQLWYHINTPQQEFFQESVGWHGYPGWIQAKDLIEVANFLPHNIVTNKKLTDVFDQHGQKIMTLSLGTRLCTTKIIKQKFQVLLPDQTIAYIACKDAYTINPVVQESEAQLRSSIIQTALQFVSDWYSWGGRSAQNDEFGISSVDCSALVHLSFLAHGLQLPRMSHEQFLRSEKIQFCTNLQPADLIYFVSITKHFPRMDHVMIYLGDDQILESTLADEHKVRIVSFQDRMGKSCNMIQHGDVIIWNDEEFYVYFGSFLQNKELIQTLRDNALQHDYQDLSLINHKFYCKNVKN